MRSSSPAGFDLWEIVDGLRDAVDSLARRDPDRADAAPGARRDLRAAVLASLRDESRHGAGVIRAIEERSGGAWSPTAGEVYPMLQLLADEGLVTAEQAGEHKLWALTPEGRDLADASAATSDASEPDAASGAARDRRAEWERGLAIPRAGSRLAHAAAQIARYGTPEQSERAVAALDEARRKLYAILAED